MNSLKKTLMKRDKITSNEAERLIDEVREQILSGEDPEDVFSNDLGLESDYLIDLF